MQDRHNSLGFEDVLSVHQQYLDILNALPNVVYWIDAECNLKGCNLAFVNLLGLEQLTEIKGDPYERMIKQGAWSKKRVEALRLDDMKILFSGEPQIDVEEAVVYDALKQPMYFRSRRVPLKNHLQQTVGLIVILTEITQEKNLSKQSSANPLKNKAKKPAKKSNPHVLMVEDNDVAQKVEEALLNALNCQVDIAESGDTALELFDPGKYDMIFMDIGLEDTSGYMVAKKIRELEDKTKHHVPIIALTSFKVEHVKQDVKDYFMDGVLTKPLTQVQAEQLIEHYVKHQDISVQGLEQTSDE